MKKIRAIIVDDEEFAREDLADVLAEFDNIEIAGSAQNIKEAKELLEVEEPDVVFLDIQLKDESGFDLVEFISRDQKIIFVTAYDQYAIRAFEVNAQDYLLKPVNPRRLKNALDKIDVDPEERTGYSSLEYDDSLFLLLNSRYAFVKLSSILAIQAAGDYSEIILQTGEKKLTLKPMREWEERLPDSSFCRIHRSTIVNINFIEKISEWTNGSFLVKIKGIQNPFTMSRRYAATIKKKMG